MNNMLEDYYPGDEDAHAVVGSQNTISEFNVDILESSLENPLEGKIFAMEHDEEGESKVVLCQLENLRSKNPWHETPVLKSVIKKEGQLENLSGEADTKNAELQKMGVYSKEDGSFFPDRINTPPISGTLIYELNDELLEDIVENEPGLFYLGEIYGSDTKAPFRLKHFGPTPEGFGEAHRIGVFGKSGSGKSVLASQMLAGFARNEEMGILVLDPQGEFHDDRFAQGDDSYDFSFHELVEQARGDFIKRDLSHIKLEDRRTFVSLLKRQGILQLANIGTEEYRQQLVQSIVTHMQENQMYPEDVDLQYLEERIVEGANQIYTSDRENMVRGAFASHGHVIERQLEEVQSLFESSPERRSVDQFIEAVLEDKEFVILDLAGGDTLSGMSLDAQEVKYILLLGIVKRIQNKVQQTYRAGDSSNVLVALDEAYEYVPQGRVRNKDLKELKRLLVQLQKSSRKYGVGWMFINQRIADFDNDVYSQLEDYVYAWGLGVGSDEASVKDIVGDGMFRTYKDLPNPKQTGIFTYMIHGGIVGVGTQGLPLVVDAFDSMDQIIDVNGLEQSDSP